jgi:hypothetical protein
MKKHLLATLCLIIIFSFTARTQDLVEVFPGFEGKGFGMLTWGDYDGDGDLDLITGGLTPNEVTQTDLYQNEGEGEFSVVENTGIPDLSNGYFDFADYDNDGDDDLLAMGFGENESKSAVFISNGDGTFTNANAGIIDKVYLGTCNWTDYDGDGDLDIFITGFLDDFENTTYVSELYNNDGSGNFTHIDNTGIQGVSYSRSVWADLDNDGDLDLYLQGLAWTGETDRATIYENNGDDTFSPIIEFLPVWLGDAAWIDYDNDGDWDLMYSGFNTNSGTRVTFLYKNTDLEFTQVADNIVGVSQTALTWADYDQDGDLDLFIDGWKNGDEILVAYIYENQGDDVFVQSDYEFIGNWFGDAEWADYDNDGDPDLVYLGQETTGNAIHTYRNDIINGIEEISDISFFIYPNPATEFITLSGINRTFDRAEIIDVLGNVVWQKDKLTTNRINIQDLKTGVYFLRLETNGNVASKKFLKQ